MNFLKKIFGEKKQEPAVQDNRPFLELLVYHAGNKSQETYKQVIGAMETGPFRLWVPAHADGSALFFSYDGKKVVHAFTSETGWKQWVPDKVFQCRSVATSDLLGFCRANDVYALGIDPGLPSAIVIDTRSLEQNQIVTQGADYKVGPAPEPLPRYVEESMVAAFSHISSVAEAYHMALIFKEGATSRRMTAIGLRLYPGMEQQQEAVRKNMAAILQQHAGNGAALLFLQEENFYQEVRNMPASLLYRR